MTRNDDHTNNIITLTTRRSALNFQAIHTVKAYWDGLRNGRPVPTRADVDPRGIQSALEYAFILERIAPGMARFRLAGMHLNDLMGMEVRSMPLTALFAPEARRGLSDLLEECFQTPQTATLTLKSEAGIGRGALEAKLLLCPLKSDLGDISRILGCLQTKGEIGRQPRRFVVTRTDVTPLVQGIAPEQQFDTTPKGTPIPAGFAEAKRGFAPARPTAPRTPPVKGKPTLRLVKSDD